MRSPKILSICPTYNRPEICKRMIESFNSTKQEDNMLLLGIDSKDPQWHKYHKINECFIDCPTGSTVTEVINIIYRLFDHYDYYHITNDDVIYQTKGWDTILSNKGKISYGSDGLQNQNLCTFPMIDGDIVRALGWLQLPSLTRYSGDQAWMIIGKLLGLLEYKPEVLIKHEWQGWDEKIGAEDLQRVNEWANTSMKDDIEKVRKMLDGN